MDVLWIIVLIIIGVWAAVWKAIALWYSARNRQKAWYIVMFILNTASILPILYLAFFQKKRR